MSRGRYFVRASTNKSGVQTWNVFGRLEVDAGAWAGISFRRWDNYDISWMVTDHVVARALAAISLRPRETTGMSLALLCLRLSLRR